MQERPPALIAGAVNGAEAMWLDEKAGADRPVETPAADQMEISPAPAAPTRPPWATPAALVCLNTGVGQLALAQPAEAPQSPPAGKRAVPRAGPLNGVSKARKSGLSALQASLDPAVARATRPFALHRRTVSSGFPSSSAADAGSSPRRRSLWAPRPPRHSLSRVSQLLHSEREPLELELAHELATTSLFRSSRRASTGGPWGL